MVRITLDPIIRHHYCPDCTKENVHSHGLPLNIIQYEYYNPKSKLVHYATACLYHDCDIRIKKDKSRDIIPFHYNRFRISEADWNALQNFVDDGLHD